MENERLHADAVALYSSVPSFLRRFRTELLDRTELESTTELPEVIDAVGTLADAIMHGDALIAPSRRVLDAVPDTVDVPTLVAHVSGLRTAIMTVWDRELAGGHRMALRAIHQALDRVIHLVVERDVTVAKLEGLLAASPIGIAFLDQDLRYVRINEALARMNGRPKAEHLGRTIREVLPDDAGLIERMLRQILETGEPVVGIELGGNVGSFFPVRSQAGAVVGIGGIVADVSERKRMETELRYAVQQREDLIAVVSHDLRNPLGTITLGSTLMATDETLSPRSRKHLDLIQRAARRMERLIDDLLDMASIQVGRISLEIQRVSARDVVDEAIESVQSIAHEKHISVINVSELSGIDIAADPDRLQRVFSNLIGNALKFCNSGDTIRVGGEPAGDYVKFCVEDTGPGIDPAVLPYLFDPYWSAPEYSRRGVGLGLFICHGIIAAHGGAIGVESDLGHGARFHFTLPVAR